MERYRTWNGKLCYDLKEYTVIKGDNKIIKHEQYYDTKAVIAYKDMPFWEDTPIFDSFIHAVKFLKENIDYLL